MRVFITGLGIISAIGDNKQTVLQNIRSLRSGVGAIELLDTVHKAAIPLAEVKYSNAQLAELAGITNPRDYSRTALLGIIAAREALAQANLSVPLSEVGIVSATSVGGMDRSESFYEEYLKNASTERVQVLLTHECGDSTEKIADYLGLRGTVTTVSTACSSSANAIMTGARLIRHGLLDTCLVGGTDALTRFTLNGFDTLKILDHQPCQPFDQQRRGLNLGEGAAFLVLESEKTVRSEHILAELTGYANTNDAYHQTASSPDGQGALLAMQKALSVAHLQPQQIDYINAHGTGTQNNDLSEGRAIQQLFEGKIPRFSSTKSYTGHTLGAAGAVEAVLSVLAIQNGLIYPNLRWSEQMGELYISPETQLQEGQHIRHVLSNSFGFGGNSTSLVFSKYTDHV